MTAAESLVAMDKKKGRDEREEPSDSYE